VKEKSENRRVIIGDLMVGLGGLEPPTSPLSGARSSHLSYRPLQNRVAIAYNSFSLRCLSVIRNCVQIRSLCTRQQFLHHFSFLSVLKVRVVARDSQAGMSIRARSVQHSGGILRVCGSHGPVWFVTGHCDSA
jgi:hypothetical protein